MLDQVDDQRLGHVRSGRLHIRWPIAFGCVAVQGELADDQDRAPGVGHRTVHLALVVIEDPELPDPFSHLPSSGRCVVVGDPDQDTQARLDGPDRLAFDGDLGPTHPLYQRPHLDLRLASRNVRA